MGIANYRTYAKYVDCEAIGEPVNGAYTLKQVVEIVTRYHDFFIEPLELENSVAIYRKQLQSVALLKEAL